MTQRDKTWPNNVEQYYLKIVQHIFDFWSIFERMVVFTKILAIFTHFLMKMAKFWKVLKALSSMPNSLIQQYKHKDHSNLDHGIYKIYQIKGLNWAKGHIFRILLPFLPVIF